MCWIKYTHETSISAINTSHFKARTKDSPWFGLYFFTLSAIGHTLVIEITQKGVNDVNCKCNNKEMPMFPGDATIAMAYVPWQELREVYEPEVAFERATLFPELDKPFRGGVKCCG